MRMLELRAAAALSAAAIALPAGAAPAAADSIVYTAGGDVWRATPDGATTRQLTHEGIYGEASQADDGTIVATAGRRLRRLDAAGTVVADFPAAALADENWAGPFDPDVSPDGTKVAYSWLYESRGSSSPNCPLTPDECTLGYIRGGSTVSWADRATALGELSWWRHWTQPSWIGNDRVLLGGRDVPVMFDRAGIGALGAQGQAPEPWFGAGVHLADGDMTRAGDRIAYVTGIGQSELTVWALSGAPGSEQPRFCFSFTGPSGHFADPTWSPDGRTLAWSEDDGTWTATIPGCSGDGVASRKIVPLGKLPDWGPADLVVTPPPDDRRDTPRDVPRDVPRDTPRREQPRRQVPNPTGRRCLVPKAKTGATAAPVKRALSRNGCRVKVRTIRSAKVRRGRVVKLSAKAGRRLAYRATVTLYVSRGRR